MIKLRNPGYLLREFCVIVPSHWPAQVGRNQFINTNFTKLITRISKPSEEEQNNQIPNSATENQIMQRKLIRVEH